MQYFHHCVTLNFFLNSLISLLIYELFKPMFLISKYSKSQAPINFTCNIFVSIRKRTRTQYKHTCILTYDCKPENLYVFSEPICICLHMHSHALTHTLNVTLAHTLYTPFS